MALHVMTCDRLKTILKVTADTTPRGEQPDRTLIQLAYASMGLFFPGDAPESTLQLARCITLLREYPWMRERAFEFLRGLNGSAWPYLVDEWDKLENLLELETRCSIKPEAYAPQTHHLLHWIVSRRCAKSFCSHSMEDHAFEAGEYTGRCTIAGCACGHYKAPESKHA